MTASFLAHACRLGGAILVACVCASGVGAQTTVLSAPVGVMSQEITHGSSGLAFPLLGADLFVGVATGNGPASITFGPSAGNVGNVLQPGQRYYAEIATGPLEGERFDLDTAATISAASATVVLDLGAHTHSTLGTVPPDALTGARCLVRPHVTLGDLPDMFSPALSGDRRHRYWSDSVSLLGAQGLETYFLGEDDASWFAEDERHGGEWGRRHHAWRTHHRHPLRTDVRDLVIPPDVSVIVSINAPGKTWTHEGGVRTNAFRKNLVRGMQAFASGFPIDLSPTQIGAFVDPADPAATRWRGSNILPLADHIEVLFSGRLPLRLYYLRGDGRTWHTLAAADRRDYAQQPVLGSTDMIVIRRNNADPAYVIPRPFEL